MTVTIVYVYVKEEFLDDFISETGMNHSGSVNEPGNIRFDVLQDVDDPCSFTLYEAYDSEEDAAAHKLTPHYQRWKGKVEPWMARPRKGVKHHILFPKGSK